MNVLKVSIWLSVIPLVIAIIFSISEASITLALLKKQKDTGLTGYYSRYDYRIDFHHRLLCCFIGIFWTLIPAFGVLSFLPRFRKHLFRCGIFWFIITFLTIVLNTMLIVYSDHLTKSYLDLDYSDLHDLEYFTNCCFYAETGERIDENGNTFIDYEIYPDCPLIDKDNPNNVWECRFDDYFYEEVCYASGFNITQLHICDSDSDTVPFTWYASVMFLYAFTMLIYTILVFVLNHFSKTEENTSNKNEELVEEQLNENAKLVEKQINKKEELVEEQINKNEELVEKQINN